MTMCIVSFAVQLWHLVTGWHLPKSAALTAVQIVSTAVALLYAIGYTILALGVLPNFVVTTRYFRPLSPVLFASIATVSHFTNRYIKERQEYIDLQNSFIANASHELRTPLSLIQGFASMLQLPDVYAEAETAQKHLRTIQQASERMTWVVTNILQVQHIKSGVALETAFFDLAAEVRSVVDSLAYTARDQGVTLVLGEMPEECLYDGIHDYIALAVSNLVNNAIKFSPNGRVTVSVHCDPVWLHVEVKDNGIGIPADKLIRIFDQFYQVDGSDRRRFGGTGIGLYFVSQAAARHDGYVDVESEVGAGSTFTLRLPR